MPVTAIPEEAVLLHIGPHKTGTTAIQALLADARDELAAHGVTYPGKRTAQHAEARAMLHRPGGWAHDSAPLPSEEQWSRLVRRSRKAPGRVVISSEFFALSEPSQCQRVVSDIGADRLHLVLAARNPGSIALSTWQQVLRDGKADRLEDWLDERFRRTAPTSQIASSGFWSWADAANLVDRWSEALDVDRIRVVVIDEADRALLPTTFEELLDLPSGLLADRPTPKSNRSLTAPEAELMRQAMALTKDQMSWTEFAQLFRMGYAHRLIDQRVAPADEARSVLPEWATQQAVADATATKERLLASGATVIGDLDNLLRVPPAGEAPPIEDVPVELAAEAIAGVVEAAQRRFRKDEVRIAELTAALVAHANCEPETAEQVDPDRGESRWAWARAGRRARAQEAPGDISD